MTTGSRKRKRVEKDAADKKHKFDSVNIKLSRGFSLKSDKFGWILSNARENIEWFFSSPASALNSYIELLAKSDEKTIETLGELERTIRLHSRALLKALSADVLSTLKQENA